MNIATIQQYIQQAGDPGFRRRVQLHPMIESLPYFMRRYASRMLWAGGLHHMRHFDQKFTFTRGEHGLASLRHEETEIASGRPLDQLIGRIDRPVTLVATGPSALDHDWAALRDSGRMVVGVTGGATFLRERGITPDLLVLSDPDFCKTGGYHIRDAAGVPLVAEFRSAVALHTHYPDALKDRPVAFIERVNKWYGVPAMREKELHRLNEASGAPFFIQPSTRELRMIGWSHRLDQGFFPSATVAVAALQVLVAMGATEIEIVGMDLSGGSSVYTSARPSRLSAQYDSVILPSFRAMHRALRKRGVSIRNLSPTCPLPRELFQFE